MADDLTDELRAISQFVGAAGPKLREAAAEIERLRAQVEHAHAILASEGAAWLVLGSNHEQSWRESLTPAIEAYWGKCGSYFKEAHR